MKLTWGLNDDYDDLTLLFEIYLDFLCHLPVGWTVALVIFVLVCQNGRSDQCFGIITMNHLRRRQQIQ